MSNFVTSNDTGALSNRWKKMDANERMTTQRIVSGRRPMCPKWSSYPKVFGQRPTLQPRTLSTTITSPVYNVNQCEKTTKRKVFHYILSKDNSNELKTCENAWVPSCLREKNSSNCGSMGDKDTQTEEIRKKFLSILNKISPENMVLLTNDIVSLPIETDDHLKKVIEILFQKAIDEPNFSPQYAYVCTTLNNKEVKSKDKMAKTSFKKLLTKCCQNRFELMHEHEQSLAKSLKDLNDCNDQDMKKQLQSHYDQDERVHRKRSVGNCRFMCELYKAQILTNQILETCMKHLLRSPNEETLECACNILKYAGKTLNNKATFKKLSEYMSTAYKTRIPTRIRFMIMDTIELKDNNWIPRGSRTEPESCNTNAKSNAGRPEIKQSTHVQNISAVLPTKNTQRPNESIKSKSITEIQKNDERKNKVLVKFTKTTDFSYSSSPISLDEKVKGKTSSVCISLETKKKNSCQTSDEKNTEIQEIQEKCRSIVDKMTPENMILSANSIISLPIKTNECLITIIEVLFQKAVDNPLFAPQYAYVCSMMKNTKVHSEDKKTQTSFRNMLIKMCQDAFESMYTRKRAVAKDRNGIESCKDKTVKNQLQSKFDQNEIVHRRRSVANCRFMCELLKVNVMVPPILEMCVARLVQSPKELSLECLCVILQHARGIINHSDAFEKLHEYSAAHKPIFSSRIRSMVMDTLKLRYNNEGIPHDVCDEPPLLDETNGVTFAGQPVNCVGLSCSDLRPVLTVCNNSLRLEMNTRVGKEPRRNEPFSEKGNLNVYNIVKPIINPVTADNMNTTIKDLSVHIKNIDIMERLIDVLFSMAKDYPKTILELVGICSLLRNTTTSSVKEHIKTTTLKKQIAIRCNEVLLSGIQNDPSANEFTAKESYAFIGELFNEKILSTHILLEFLRILPEKMSDRALENICVLFLAAGKNIEKVYSLKKIVRKLTDMVSNDVEGIFSHRSVLLLKSLGELRDKNWVP